ncbi:2-oxoglutarate (2OG) and Fe(II)-dependent oxygenase superfamily protein [Melia azedarach]|uniref:2-oxoglutarate (2OG) and Fe(II)-dependent oxygenase superfamily protein n=1 Tax=Melia azedarach TaxID=155640 RepID=A0ACC1YTQ8_MELAZ|nr:2-oxoglutarate (2OG) and Fe(II)-dependent oxygenase superfamily protein [Melia azedarach]
MGHIVALSIVQVSSMQEKLSIATFYNPRYDAEVRPASKLAKKPMTVVPSRYIRLQQEAAIISDDILISKIPVIDMQNLLSENSCKFVEHNMANLGGSLLVPCVQELAKKTIAVVPSRYIRPEQEAPIISDDALISEIPVIDMQSLLSGELENSELAKLDFACKEWGFFQLVNHGVSSSFLEKLKKEIQEFFNLSMEEKKKYWQLPGEVEGFGQAFVVSEEQKLDWGDIFFMTTLPVHLRRPNLFPKLPLTPQDTLEVYSMEIKNSSSQFDLENGKKKVIGLTPHSDASGLTILLQINEVEGLQIKKNGKWLPVTPVLPNAFIVNIGDTLEIITNGTYRSIEHRATVNSVQDRLSIATFYNPRYDGELRPASSLISEKRPASFRTITVEGYLKGLFARELREKSCLDLVRIKHGQSYG